MTSPSGCSCSPRTCWYHVHTIEPPISSHSFSLTWLILLIARDKPLDVRLLFLDDDLISRKQLYMDHTYVFT